MCLPSMCTLFPYTTLFRSHRNGLVLTNKHVLIAVLERSPHAVARRSRGFRVIDGAFVDFAAESGSADVRRYRIVERSEEHTSELQSRRDLVCRLLLEKKH